MDHSAQQLSELDASLGQATAFERYQEAAELKKKLDDLNGTDVVEEVMEVRARLPYVQFLHIVRIYLLGMSTLWEFQCSRACALTDS